MNNMDEVEAFFCQLHKGNQCLIMEVVSKLADVQRVTESELKQVSHEGEESI